MAPPRRADVLDLQDSVLTNIKKTLTVNGIDLPFPTQQILFHDQTEATDGDRAHQREGWPAGKGDVPQSRSSSSSLKRLAEIKAQRNRDSAGRAAHDAAVEE